MIERHLFSLNIANVCKMLPGPGEKKSDVEGVSIDATVTDRGDGTSQYGQPNCERDIRFVREAAVI